MTAPEQLITIVPADVGVILLTKAGLDEYRRAHRGENRRLDVVLVAMTEAAIRWRDMSDRGQFRAPDADTAPSSARITTTQAADLTGVSDRTIRRAISEGRLLAERAGRAYLVSRDDLGRYCTNRRA